MATLNWKNRTLWTGDNLGLMRGMNSESIDLIYLDPPFNSNRDYAAPIGSEAAGAAFKDTWALSDIDLAWHGEIAEESPDLYAVIDAAGLAQGKGMKSYLIMMAVRLLEMCRLLKSTGSIYLHCDPTASHYLKMLMDCIFGKNNFRNEITWQRHTSLSKGSQYTPKTWGNTTDTILFYAGSGSSLRPYRSMTEEESDKQFPNIEPETNRRYNTRTPIFSTPSMGARPNLCYEWRGFTAPHASGWRLSKERLEEEYQKGSIIIKPNGRLERRKYERDFRGKQVGNLWTDIPIPIGKERVGYPTQKPLALLDRIIRASSSEGDVVLDPFAGCATACVAAERLNREWVGIDFSPLAAKLVKSRLHKEMCLWYEVDHRTDIPHRTDLGKLPHYKTHKHTLFGKQEGHCAGCEVAFPFRNFTVDHIVPRSRGGHDHIDNLQLLCNACNSQKGSPIAGRVSVSSTGCRSTTAARGSSA